MLEIDRVGEEATDESSRESWVESSDEEGGMAMGRPGMKNLEDGARMSGPGSKKILNIIFQGSWLYHFIR